MVDEPLGGPLGAEPVEMPLQPAQEVDRGRIEAAGADDDGSGRGVGQRRAIETVAAHEARRLVVRGREGRVVEPERLEDTLGDEIWIGPLRGGRQRGGEQVEAEIRVEDGRSRREQQRIGLEQGHERFARDVGERIARRPRRMRGFARQSRGVGREIDEPDRPPALRQWRDEVGVFGQGVGERDHASAARLRSGR